MQKDSWAIDYQATKNVLDVATEEGAKHFVLLSAICVQKPLLEFQHAKLKLEEALQSAGNITYSIVRPTAFFKSLAGQVQSSDTLLAVLSLLSHLLHVTAWQPLCLKAGSMPVFCQGFWAARVAVEAAIGYCSD